MSFYTSFLDVNRKISEAFTKFIGLETDTRYAFHKDLVFKHQLEKYITKASSQNQQPLLVLDIGCGMRSFLSEVKVPRETFQAFGLDISPEDISRNKDLDHVITYDACSITFDRDLAAYKASFDLVLSYSFLEHVAHPETTHRLVNFLLKPSGIAIHCYPALFDPLLFAGHLLPTSLASRVLFFIEPFRAATGKFKTYYKFCRGMSPRLKRHFSAWGFDVVESNDFYGSRYLAGFFPFQIIIDVFYWLVILFNIHFFAGHSCVVLRKTASV